MKNTKFWSNVIFVCAAVLILLTAMFTFTGCAITDADMVNHNLSQDAAHFRCERRITVYNARTDKIVLYAEGYMDISNDAHNELVVTVKTGPNEYKKNYIYLNEYTMYVVEDITGTHTDPYHYKLYFHTQITPDIEVVP